ncbi:LacI family transcriptional regulator [Deinococcus sp. Arct2-2]|nr:LacI family transcriptional regulator [Deinococcus sp. Arct2-2]
MSPKQAQTVPHLLSGRAATVRDVAQAAGVSIATASKALNSTGSMREETRERVRTVARDLNYRPNELFQSVLRGRSFTVGLVASSGRFSLPLLEGIEDALGEAELSVFLCYAQEASERELRHLGSLLAKRVDGIIVAGASTDPRPAILLDTNLPLLYAYTRPETPGSLALQPDDHQGAALAAEHLIGLGRRRFLHLTGPPEYEAVQQRRNSLQGSLARAGLEPAQVVHVPWNEPSGYEAMWHLLQHHHSFDALFCGNDQLARGAQEAMIKFGLSIPNDVSVVGFDNWTELSEAARPALTTVDMNLHELGRSAGRHLLELINGQQKSGVQRLPCHLVVRNSCGASLRPPHRQEKEVPLVYPPLP